MQCARGRPPTKTKPAKMQGLRRLNAPMQGLGSEVDGGALALMAVTAQMQFGQEDRNEVD